MKQMENSMKIFGKEEFTAERHREIHASMPKEDILLNSSPLKAIRRKCVECAGGNAESAARCSCYSCPLWDYRFGTNPYL